MNTKRRNPILRHGKHNRHHHISFDYHRRLPSFSVVGTGNGFPGFATSDVEAIQEEFGALVGDDDDAAEEEADVRVPWT